MTALEKACQTIAQRAVPKTAVPVGAEVDWMELIDKIGATIVMVIEACARNLPVFAPDADAAIRSISTGLRSPSFLARIRFRNLVAQQLDRGFFAPYTGQVAREAIALARDDEQLTVDVVTEVISPGPLRPDFRF